jgi:hypothetical protein
MTVTMSHWGKMRLWKLVRGNGHLAERVHDVLEGVIDKICGVRGRDMKGAEQHQSGDLEKADLESVGGPNLH